MRFNLLSAKKSALLFLSNYVYTSNVFIFCKQIHSFCPNAVVQARNFTWGERKSSLFYTYAREGHTSKSLKMINFLAKSKQGFSQTMMLLLSNITKTVTLK